MKLLSFFLRHPVIRYILSGSTGAVINLGVLYLFTDILGVYYITSGIIAFLCALGASFILQKKWTFGDHMTVDTHKKFVIFAIVGIINLVANTFLLYLFTDIVHFHYLIAQIIASALVAIWSFFIYRYVIFFQVIHKEKARKLLVICQKVNRDDKVLGFFHEWIVGLSKTFDSVVVICLEKGRTELPDNVKVLSLGKEERQSRLQYIIHFYWYILTERKNYEAVFVHMNQEYILLGAVPWRIFNKTVYMWRNHVSGSIFTKIAVRLCDKVFCTSEFSYTARYKKTTLMPVGIDTDVFKKDPSIQKIPHSVLFWGRISPIKNPHLLCEAGTVLDKRAVDFSMDIYGDPLPIHEPYYASLKKKVSDDGLTEKILFHAGIPNYEAPAIYNSHEVSINLSPSGLYDKTIFEAMACETLLLASSKSLYGLIHEDFIFKEGDVGSLAQKLEKVLLMSPEQKAKKGKDLRKAVIEHHSFSKLMLKLRDYIS